MPKSLLALAILLTQLLSWSGSPIYLCLDGDGECSIDGGPEHCDCCHEHSSHGEHFRDGHLGCRGGEQELGLASDGAHEAAPCDCTHIQISEQQIPVVLTPVAPPDAGRLAALYAVPLDGLKLACAGFDAARWPALSSAEARPLSARQCTVLRC
ncbi:MAG TPA: hypothetical protein VHY91_24905 [Pirellulales bacterium]|jgi:hypothetical protein|nr:hypothetical protein [Pirellulales bacterium]